MSFWIKPYVAALSGSYHVRNASLLALRRYMQHDTSHAFRVCRLVEGLADSTVEAEQILYNMVKDESIRVKNFFLSFAFRKKLLTLLALILCRLWKFRT